MKFLTLILLVIGCSNTPSKIENIKNFSDSETKNLNLYLETMEESRALKLGEINISKELKVKVSDIFIYSYNDLKAKDQGRKENKPNWLIKAEKANISFQEIFEKTENHLKNIKTLMANSRVQGENIKLNCCSTEQRSQLTNINKKITKLSSTKGAGQYKNAQEYYLANLYWLFVKND